MKIKRKVQKTLPQLIEWIEKNKCYGEAFTSDRYNLVSVSVGGILEFLGEFYEDTFTVEVEEELTEDTFFKHLIKVTQDGEHYSTDFFKVRYLIDLGTEEIHAYIDGEYKLIWTHEKGLVE